MTNLGMKVPENEKNTSKRTLYLTLSSVVKWKSDGYCLDELTSLTIFKSRSFNLSFGGYSLLFHEARSLHTTHIYWKISDNARRKRQRATTYIITHSFLCIHKLPTKLIFSCDYTQDEAC